MKKIAFVWDNFGPLHVDRCEAVARKLVGQYEVVGIEQASKSKVYSWTPETGTLFRKVTLIQGRAIEEVGFAQRFSTTLRSCLSLGRHTSYFICHYQDPAMLAVASVLRLLCRRVYTMGCSKFDDFDRKLSRELFKSLFFLPYHGAIGSGIRTRDYFRFLGVRSDRVVTPYNTVSIERIRQLSDSPTAPAGVPFGDRDFAIVARLVPKKNLSMALKAMAVYASRVKHPRSLHLYGDGPLEKDLREQAARDGISQLVHFHGFLQTSDISKALARSLCLLLPSIEEQFGNVVCEALAMNLPIIISTNCGARDELVRSGVNGFIIEPDNPDGMAFFMHLLSEDENLWERMCIASQSFAKFADSERFAEAVETLIASGHPTP
jgi:glycosyltransferase involved in cell wall biosynthesis